MCMRNNPQTSVQTGMKLIFFVSILLLLINLFIRILLIILSVKYEMPCHSLFFVIALQEDIFIFKKPVKYLVE